MVELVLTACLIANTSQCRDFKIETMYFAPVQCSYSSMATLARWAGGHPEYRVSGIACYPPLNVDTASAVK